MPGHRLSVCDFGLTGAQVKFLHGLGVLLERPPILASRGVFHCKAALARYLRHNGRAYVSVYLQTRFNVYIEPGLGDVIRSYNQTRLLLVSEEV